LKQLWVAKNRKAVFTVGILFFGKTFWNFDYFVRVEKGIDNGNLIRHDSLKEVDRNIRHIYNLLVLIPYMTRNNND